MIDDRIQKNAILDKLFKPESTALHLLCLLAVVLAVFGNSLFNGFASDDNFLTFKDKLITTVDIRGIFFTLTDRIEYLPISQSSLALDYLVWERNPLGYHLTNLFIYYLNLVAIYFLACELTILLARDDEKGTKVTPHLVGSLTALFFAVHPIHCEVVNFITQRNQLLSGFLFFLSCTLYLRYLRKGTDRGGGWYYAGSLFCFFLAILSKAMVIILPFVFLLFVFFAKRREKLKEMINLIPFGVLSAAALALHLPMAQKSRMSAGPELISFSSSILQRIAVAFQIPFFYLRKIFYPTGFVQEYEVHFAGSLFEMKTLLVIVFLLILFGFAMKLRKRYPWVLFSVICFLVTLMPVLHLVLTYPIVADRYAYLPSFSIFYGFAWLLVSGADGVGKKTMCGFGFGVVVVLSILSFSQNTVWKNDMSLWSHNVKTDASAKGYYFLAKAYFDNEDLPRAQSALKQSLEINPGYSFSLNLFGNIMLLKNSLSEAEKYLTLAIEVEPGHEEAHNNLGTVYYKKGDLPRAQREWERAADIDSGYSTPLVQLGNLWLLKNSPREAERYYTLAVQADPDDAEAHYALATVEERLHEPEQALIQYRLFLMKMSPKLEHLRDEVVRKVKTIKKREKRHAVHSRAVGSSSQERLL